MNTSRLSGLNEHLCWCSAHIPSALAIQCMAQLPYASTCFCLRICLSVGQGQEWWINTRAPLPTLTLGWKTSEVSVILFLKVPSRVQFQVPPDVAVFVSLPVLASLLSLPYFPPAVF